jgi:hypothetical protein
VGIFHHLHIYISFGYHVLYTLYVFQMGIVYDLYNDDGDDDLHNEEVDT